jgi:DNA adenine methylase
MGSKNKIAKHILPIMLAEKGDRVWVEPFVGGGNMIAKLTGFRIGNDNHPYLIALLKAVQSGWIPPTEMSKEEYYRIKAEQTTTDAALVGFVGFLCSFGGKWWGVRR